MHTVYTIPFGPVKGMVVPSMHIASSSGSIKYPLPKDLSGNPAYVKVGKIGYILL